ncbi:shikimate kinase [Novosphingopyxis sp.]|uniref:shikimate kinase n=1 Tax=Novosphingopyxis sp. TaxID=2709690 RepID=UPI003B5A8447
MLSKNVSRSDAAQRAERRSIVLVGMMGVGKSTIGRRLALRLGYEFIDADDEIELAANMSVSEIFERYGEAYFRDGERRVIARLMDGDRTVIATGGGAFCDAATRALILDRAISIWLDAPIETLVERVGRRDTRPLLRGRDPVEVLTELMARRRAFYAEAALRIQSDDGPHDRTVAAILKALKA